MNTNTYNELVPATPADLACDEWLFCGNCHEQKFMHPECGTVFCLFCDFEFGCEGCADDETVVG